MSVEEMKKVLHEKVDQLPEQRLQEVLAYVNTLVQMPEGEINLLGYVDKIFEEDRALLKRLAQ